MVRITHVRVRRIQAVTYTYTHTYIDINLSVCRLVSSFRATNDWPLFTLYTDTHYKLLQTHRPDFNNFSFLHRYNLCVYSGNCLFVFRDSFHRTDRRGRSVVSFLRANVMLCTFALYCLYSLLNERNGCCMSMCVECYH